MSQYASVFKRYEKKYAVPAEKLEELKDRLSEYMVVDQYGLHTICNIYYDTHTNELIRQSIEKPVYKEKLRLRSYGVPSLDSRVYMELKKKYKGVVYKRRLGTSLEDAMKYLDQGIPLKEDSQIYREIDYFKNFYHPVPKLFIAYDRVATYAKDIPELRITFDTRIRSRDYDLDLSKGDHGTLLMDEEFYLMEIKIIGAMPLWLSSILNELEIYPTSFSKYGNIYKQQMMIQQGGLLYV